MGFTFNEEEALASVGTSAGKKVLDTGVYDVTIITASKSVASTGTIGMDWSIQVEGQKYPNMVYGMWYEKANGDKIFNKDIIMGLVGIVGASGLTEFQKTIKLPNGDKTVTAFKELEGVKCKVAIQKELKIYQGEVQEKNSIKAFFDTDGKTYAEKASNQDPKQVEFLKKNLKDKESSEYKAYIADGGEEEETEAPSGSLL